MTLAKAPSRVQVAIRESPTMPDRLIITIDGPAGTGKTSVARELASRLGLDLLDTGAMYRAAALIAIDRGIPPDDQARIVEAVSAEDIHFDWTADPPALLCSGVSVMDRIRSVDITGIVSAIAAHADLRRLMVRKQRLIAQQHPRLVAEGRDQGSVVFPDAEVKFFLTARPEIRASRRADQMRAAGHHVDEPRLLKEIIERDRSDSTRAEGPLMCPPDGIVVDTSDMTFEQVADELERAVRARVRLNPASAR